MSLDCIYVLFLKNGEEQAEVIGTTGSEPGQFRSPAGVVVDDAGTMMLIDSKNNRLQLFDANYNYRGVLEVGNEYPRALFNFLFRLGEVL